MRGRKERAGCWSSNTIPRWSRVGWGVMARRLHLWTRSWRAKLSRDNTASGRPSAPHPLPLRKLGSALGFRDDVIRSPSSVLRNYGRRRTGDGRREADSRAAGVRFFFLVEEN